MVMDGAAQTQRKTLCRLLPKPPGNAKPGGEMLEKDATQRHQSMGMLEVSHHSNCALSYQ